MGEIRRLLQMRAAGLTLPECARRLGRSEATTYHQWRRFGPPAPRRAKFDDADLARLRALHAEGWLDREIAAAIGASARTVRLRRQALGLPSNRFGERGLAATRQGVRRRDARVNPGARASEASRVKALYAGWPGARSQSDVRVLELLYRHGHLTGSAAVSEMGYASPATGHRALARLARRGLAARAGRAGNGEILYALSPEAFQERQRHEQRQNLD